MSDWSPAVLDGPRTPTWSFSLCQTSGKWASCIRCRQCSRNTLSSIIQAAKKASTTSPTQSAHEGGACQSSATIQSDSAKQMAEKHHNGPEREGHAAGKALRAKQKRALGEVETCTKLGCQEDSPENARHRADVVKLNIPLKNLEQRIRLKDEHLVAAHESMRKLHERMCAMHTARLPA